MNILVVSPQLPYPPAWGFAIRVYQLIRHLSHHHAVTLVAYRLPHEDVDLSPLSNVCTVRAVPAPRSLWGAKRRAQLRSLASTHSYRSSSLRSPEMAQTIRMLVRAHRYDIVQVESSPMAWFDAGGSPLVVDEHNIESELVHRMHGAERSAWRRAYNWLEFMKLRSEERQTWQRSAGVVLTSPRDMASVRRLVSTVPAAVVPNSVDTDYFRPAEDVDVPSLVFTGALNYRPNVDAVLYFAREILPRIRAAHPSVHFTIVGGGAPAEVAALRGPSVTVTGLVPDVRPYLRSAAVVVVPLRMGGGTRLKVLEAMAMAKAVVSTSLGVEGLAVTPDAHLLIADDAASFAARVLRLLQDRDARRMLGRHGRSLVEREYTWGAAGQRLETFYHQLLRGSERVA